MAIIENGIKHSKILIKGIPYNALVNGNKIWKDKHSNYAEGMITWFDGKEHGANNENWIDLSEYKKDGTLYNFLVNAWQSNYSLEFNGSNNYIQTGLNLRNDLNNGFTVEAVVKFDDKTQSRALFGKSTPSPGLLCEFNGNNLVAGIYDGTTNYLTIPNTVLIDGYNHILLSYDKNIFKVYINNELVGSKVYGSVQLANSVMTIGHAYTSTDLRHLKGSIKSVIVYNRALNEIEIAQNYNEHIKNGYIIDYTKLQILYQETLPLNDLDYTDMSWEAFLIVKDKVELMLTKKGSDSKIEINDLIAELKEAMDNLVDYKIENNPYLFAQYITKNQNSLETLLDSSGNEQHATMNNFNSNSWKENGSLAFNGIDSLVITPVPHNIMKNGGTIEVVVKFEDRSNGRGLIGDIIPGSGESVLGQWNSNKLMFGFSSNNPYSVPTESVPNGYVVLTQVFNGKTMSKLYINGIEISSVNNNIDLTNISTLFTIGRCNITNGYLMGSIKYVSFYDGELTGREIAKNYNEHINENRVAPLNMLASYDARNHDGFKFFLDSSGNENTATMTNFTEDSWKEDVSLKMNGINTLITTPLFQSIFNSTQGATLETIVKFEDRVNYKGIAGDRTNNYSLLFGQFENDEGNNLMVGFFNGQKVPIPIDSVPTKYFNLMMTYAENQIKVYLNGINVGSKNTGSITVLNNQIVIGRAYNDVDRYMLGNIKLFNIYQKALTQKEITGKINQYVDEELLNPNFEHYNIDGLKNTIITTETSSPTMVDISRSGNYYKSISHQQQHVGYETKYRTIQPSNTVSNNPFPSSVPYGQSSTVSLMPPANLNHIIVGVNAKVNQYTFNGTYWCGAFNLKYQGGLRDAWSLSCITSGGKVGSTITNTVTYRSSSFTIIGNGVLALENAGTAGMTITSSSITFVYNSYQEAYQEAYYYYTTYTNANYKSGKINISSNKAELVIENNQQTITSLKGYDGGLLKGNLANNTNARFVTINNWEGKDYTFELAYAALDLNLFSKLYIKNQFEDISLNDISYEVKLELTHNLNASMINTLVTEDNANRNIYRKKIILDNFPYINEKVMKELRPDYKNIRFIIKDSKILLNHYIDEIGRIYIELPNKNLTVNKNVISAIIMPKTYTYDGIEIGSEVPTLTLEKVDYIYL